MTGTVIATIENRHGDGCGDPPAIDPDEYDYVSYFENVYGEQAAFVYDAAANEGRLYMGDAGWEAPTVLPPAEIAGDTDGPFPVVLNDAEKLWLNACFAAIQPRL